MHLPWMQSFINRYLKYNYFLISNKHSLKLRTGIPGIGCVNCFKRQPFDMKKKINNTH